MTVVNPSTAKTQNGAMLLEALVGILIFSVGILAVVGLQAASIKSQADAKYRADAAYLANQVIGIMWGDRANLASYAHHATGAPGDCNPSGAASTQVGTAGSNMNQWLANVAATLPGASEARQQIVYSGGPPVQMTITLCWKGPQETTWHHHTVIAYVNS